MLAINGLTIAYGPVQVVHGVTMKVEEGQIVALIGPNGAGKSSVLRAVSGLIRPKGGDISFLGVSLVGVPPHEIANAGIAHVMEGRHLFGGLSVEDNLILAGSRDDKSSAGNLESIYQRWPRLRERREQLAGTLSGGEQQMLAIGRALMMRPRLLILDEPSWGLAPRIVRDLMETFSKLRREGVTILLCEQMAKLALKVCDYAYVMTGGQIMLQGTSAELLADPELRATYLGGEVGEASRAARDAGMVRTAEGGGAVQTASGLPSTEYRGGPRPAAPILIERSEREKARAERARGQMTRTGGLSDLTVKPIPSSQDTLRDNRYAASESRRQGRIRDFEANKRRTNVEEELTTIRKEIAKLGTAPGLEYREETQPMHQVTSGGPDRSGLEAIRRQRQVAQRGAPPEEPGAGQSGSASSKWASKERARREREAQNRRNRSLEEADPEHLSDRARQKARPGKRSEDVSGVAKDRTRAESLRRTQQSSRMAEQMAAVRVTPQPKRETPDRKLKELGRRQKQSRGSGGSNAGKSI